MTYEAKPLSLDPKSIKGISEKVLVSHYENNYVGAVKRLTAISAQLAELDFGKAPTFLINGLKREELIALIFRETTTLGVRFYSAERRVQTRDWVEVTTSHGVIRIKAAHDGFAPEYEDARKIAAADLRCV